MALEGMTLAGKIASNILGMTLGQAIMGSGKKKKSRRLLLGIKKRRVIKGCVIILNLLNYTEVKRNIVVII